MPKTEVQLVCSSCKEEFICHIAPQAPEEKWTQIQDLLKEKEPKCEKCRGGAWLWTNTAVPTFKLDALEAAMRRIQSEAPRLEPEIVYVSFDRWKQICKAIKNAPPCKIELKPRNGASTVD